MLSDSDMLHLRRALELAEQARGGVSPRPPVGAVIVKDGQVVGEGQTEPRPGRHAEVAAIQAGGDAADGATMFCSLEPHAHQGVSPPCTEEIIRAGISRLVCPIEDPNPQVDGNGFRRLRSAGVEVVTEVPESTRKQAEELISGFAMLTLHNRPQFTLKYAMSMDGKIATSTGESQWITGDEARREANRLRQHTDALVTGIGTVLADDPRMTARDENGSATGRPRLRVVLDTHGRMPASAAILKEPGDVLWIVGEGASLQNSSMDPVRAPVSDGEIDLEWLVSSLADRGCCDVLIEAGGRLAGGFAAAGLVDRVAAFIGPVVIGGAASPGPVGDPGFPGLGDALRVTDTRMKALGDSFLITGRVAR